MHAGEKFPNLNLDHYVLRYLVRVFFSCNDVKSKSRPAAVQKSSTLLCKYHVAETLLQCIGYVRL